MGIKGWKEHQRALYAKRAKSERRKRCNWLEQQLTRPFPLQSLPLEWAEPDHEENALDQMDHGHVCTEQRVFLLLC